MNILNHQPPGIGNGHSVFPAPPQHRHQDACHRQHILPVAFTLPPPPPPAPNSTLRCSVQPSRSRCSPAPLVGDSNGSSSQRDEPLVRRRSSDPDAAVDALQGRRRHVNRSAVLGTTSVRGICNHLPADHLQLDGGDEETVELAPRYHHPTHHHLTGEDLEVKRKPSSSGAADDVDLGPRTSGTLGFVRSLMDDGCRYFRVLTQDNYRTPRSHLDRQRQHQQLLIFPDDHEEPPPRVVTLAVSVLSAVKLEGKQIDQIARKMRKLTGFENLRVENTVDPSLIAGFVIRYGDDDAHVIDLSVKGRLAELEARLQSSDQIAGADGGCSFPDMHALDSY